MRSNSDRALIFSLVEVVVTFCVTARMDTPHAIRELIIHHHQQGVSARRISSIVNVPWSTVKDLIKRYKETGAISTTRKGNCGRKRKLGPRTERLLARYSVRNPRATARELQAEIGGQAVSVHVNTVKRSLRRSGRNAYAPRVSPSLNKAQRCTRLCWGRQHRGWTEQQWRQVVFSDECSFDVRPQPRTQYVRRGCQEQVRLEHTRQHRPFLQRLMVWGCFSAEGPGPLVQIQGTMDAAKYIAALENNLLPAIRDLVPHGHFLYMHDNAPCHKAHAVANFLDQNGIEVLPWPPYSPDMNPLENLWNIVKKRVHRYSFSSKEQLFQQISDIWHNDPTLRGCCSTLIDSMPRRVSAMCKSQGGYTKY